MHQHLTDSAFIVNWWSVTLTYPCFIFRFLNTTCIMHMKWYWHWLSFIVFFLLMISLGTRTYGSSQVEQRRVAWKNHGNLLAPARAPKFNDRKPSSTFPSDHHPIPALSSTSLPWRVGGLIKGWHWDMAVWLEVAFAKVIWHVCMCATVSAARENSKIMYLDTRTAQKWAISVFQF